MSLLIFLLICLFVKWEASAADEYQCPMGCKCTRYTGVLTGVEVRVDCIPNDQQRGGISQIPVDLSQDVTQLLLDNNALSHLRQNAFFMYRHLKILSLRRNFLAKIDTGSFANLHELKSLDLSENEIEFIEADVFKDLPKLEVLSIANNRLHTVPAFSSLPSLLKIDFGSNNLTDCTLPSGLSSSKLQSVTLTGNVCSRLTSSTFSSCKQLITLILSNTRVSFIEPDTFKALTSLEELDLSDSPLLSWAVVQDVKFPANLKSLQLDTIMTSVNNATLTDSFVQSLPISLQNLKLVNCGLTGTMPDFRHLANLTYLNVGSNQFQSLPGIENNDGSGFPKSLEFFLGNYNKISEVPSGAFAGLMYLEVVDLSRNNIEIFSPSAFGVAAPSVTGLILTQTLRSSFPKGLLPSLPNLERLIVDDNDFITLDLDIADDFALLTKLKKLDLSGNQLSDLPPGFFTKLPSLTHLVLNNNFLGPEIVMDEDGLIFEGLDSVYSLALEENDVSYLPPKIFWRMGRDLRSLNLLGNRLKRFPSQALTNFSNLSVINADANDIHLLEPSDFSSIPPTAVVHLWSNPIDCSCENFEFFRWLEQTNAVVSRPSITAINCWTPEELKNHPPPPVSQLTPKCSAFTSSLSSAAFSSSSQIFVPLILLIVCASLERLLLPSHQLEFY